MNADLQTKCFDEGFARGLLKCAGTSAVEDAAKVIFNPASRKEMAALGESVFRKATQQGDPLGSFKNFLFPKHDQVHAISQIRNTFAKLLRSAGPADRPVLHQQMHRQMRDAFAELGAGAAPRIRFQQNAVPALAGLGIGGAVGGAVGNVQGRDQREGEIAQGLATNVPIYKRLQYALFPSSVLAHPRSPAPSPEM